MGSSWGHFVIYLLEKGVNIASTRTKIMIKVIFCIIQFEEGTECIFKVVIARF